MKKPDINPGYDPGYTLVPAPEYGGSADVYGPDYTLIAVIILAYVAYCIFWKVTNNG